MSDTGSNSDICWHEPGPFHARCRKPHDGHRSIMYGRCRSGQRWFWAVSSWELGRYEEISEFGWEPSEAQAVAAIHAVATRIADGRPAVAYPRHGYAADKLKEINKAKRAARPAPDTSDARRVEYLYAYDVGWSDWGERYVDFYRFRVTRRTAKRVFYVRDAEFIDESGEPRDDGAVRNRDGEIGFVHRGTLAKDGFATNRSRVWEPDYQLYASLAALHADREHGADAPPADLAALKRAMAAAHPDRGGSNEAFIAARERYLAALRRCSRAAP